ncbi:prepilin-type N-terminal cleavage/methylation domain-containing protein [Pseudomonas sp. TMP25]|uniref:PilW family protein n=1 Tax=Pseudomonas sp. TMP25 TaxID=3136561 RepID=UPI0031011255
MILPSNQRGLSLIELMVTLVLSSLLLLGVLQLFISTNATDRTSTELARVQETGRVAIELIAREARRVGYQGCVGATVTTEGGGITYPGEALDGTATSLTFNYARPDPAGTFANRDCNNGTLSTYQITFSNCGANICVTAPDIGNNQQLVANANFNRIDYIEPCAANSCIKAAVDADLPTVNKLQITLAVNDSRGEFAVPRTFTSIIELRNRL